MVNDGIRRRDFWVNTLRVDDTAAADYISGVTASFGIVSTNTIVAGSIVADGSITQYIDDKAGTYCTDRPAVAIISGGMWVVGSAASGTNPNVVIKPAPANCPMPLGICIANCASGADPVILVQGYYQGLKADETVNAQAPICMGSGAALNTVQTADAAATARGVALMGAGSNGVTFVYLW
jgi:hypothetical protein